MASGTEYASVPMKIACFEDIEEALRNNHTLSQYRELLKHVNTCILDFEELETNRTYLEVFSDWRSGKREKISENLVPQLKQLKEALLTGMGIYTKLLVQKEILHKYFRDFKIVNELIGEEKEIQESPNLDNVVNPSGNEDKKYFSNMKVVIGGIVVSSDIGAIIYTICEQFESLATPIPGTSEIGKVLYQSTRVRAFLCITSIIYKLANFNDGDRSVKYQKIQELLDGINNTLLDEIRVKNKILSGIYEAIDKQLHSREVIMYLASPLYSKSKDRALKEIQADKSYLNSEICEKLSIKIAEITCKSYLKHVFNCSNEETEEILKEIQGLEDYFMSPSGRDF